MNVILPSYILICILKVQETLLIVQGMERYRIRGQFVAELFDVVSISLKADLYRGAEQFRMLQVLGAIQLTDSFLKWL